MPLFKIKTWSGVSLIIWWGLLTPACLATPPSNPGPVVTSAPITPSLSPQSTSTATRPAALHDAPTMSSPSTPTKSSFSSQNDLLTLPTASATPTAVSIPCTVNVNTLPLREGPGPGYRLIKTLSTNEAVSAFKCAPGGEWLLVETRQKEIGWLQANAVACQNDLTRLPMAGGVTPPTPLPAPPGALPSPKATFPAVTPAPTPTLPANAWRGEYYDNASLLGEPVLIREDPDLNFNWILDSPAPGLPADNFSARWTRLFDFIEGGDYRFFAEVDDGIRLYVDGWLVIDAWHTFLPVPYSGDFADIEPGYHVITVEYFESGGHANIKVWAEKTRFIAAEWRGEYYDNADLQDPAFLIRSDETIDFDWGEGSPAPGIEGNSFSVRWRKTFFFEGGDYKFFAQIADRDRVKIYLDGWLLVDEYQEDGGLVSGYFAQVGAGYHDITVEYHENVGRAGIKFYWEKD